MHHFFFVKQYFPFLKYYDFFLAMFAQCQPLGPPLHFRLNVSTTIRWIDIKFDTHMLVSLRTNCNNFNDPFTFFISIVLSNLAKWSLSELLAHLFVLLVVTSRLTSPSWSCAFSAVFLHIDATISSSCLLLAFLSVQISQSVVLWPLSVIHPEECTDWSFCYFVAILSELKILKVK